MKSYLISIICFIIMLILLSITIHVLNIKNAASQFVLYDPIYIRSKLRTGDVILFSSRKYKNLFDKICYTARTTFLGANVGHLGVVYRENDDIYIVESTNTDHIAEDCALLLNNKKKGGVRMISYDILMERYSKEYKGIFAVRFIDKPINNNKFMRKLNNYKRITFPEPYKLVILLFVELFISKKFAEYLSTILVDKNHMMCGGFVYSILRDCNVLEEYPEKLFWPYNITQSIFNDLQRVKYSKIYRYSLD